MRKRKTIISISTFKQTATKETKKVLLLPVEKKGVGGKISILIHLVIEDIGALVVVYMTITQYTIHTITYICLGMYSEDNS